MKAIVIAIVLSAASFTTNAASWIPMGSNGSGFNIGSGSSNTTICSGRMCTSTGW